MANVVNRTTKEALPSVNTPDFGVADWIINPPNWVDVVSWEQRYRLISGDVISLADAGQQAAIDAAILAAQVAADKIAQQNEFDEKRVLKALAELLVSEFNNHSDRTNGILDAIDGASDLAGLKADIGTITNLPTRTFSQLRTAIRDNIDAGVN